MAAEHGARWLDNPSLPDGKQRCLFRNWHNVKKNRMILGFDFSRFFGIMTESCSMVGDSAWFFTVSDDSPMDSSPATGRPRA